MLDDRNIVNKLASKIGSKPQKVEYNQSEFVTSLDLSGLGLVAMPDEIFSLKKLQTLLLSENKITQIPPEIYRLTDLQELSLGKAITRQHGNLVSTLPPEIGLLSSLEVLDLTNNQLTNIPREISQLKKLKKLDLYGNRLTNLSDSILELTQLEELNLWGNEIDAIPTSIANLSKLRELNIGSNQLTQLPLELFYISTLETLWVAYNNIELLPSHIDLLTKLTTLGLHGNPIKIDKLPLGIWKLPNLSDLGLGSKQLYRLPPQITDLTNLQTLILHDFQLIELPVEIGNLSQLQTLSLSEVPITKLPSEIGKLKGLKNIHLQETAITELPTEIGNLTQLEHLQLDDNPLLRTPPPEIIAKGTKEILDFLKELAKGSVERFETKLILIGEGRAGKSSLLRALQGKDFNSTLDSTHGIEVDKFELPHFHRPNVQIKLNTWDFGGQQIYHATHQFFLTKRSIYLVVWNSGVDTDQGRLDYWLKTIRILAPDSPVLLVATHIDQREPDFNFSSYKEAYPQIVGYFGVSNKTAAGIVELKFAISKFASQLPIMGQKWPQKWVLVEQAMLKNSNHHIDLTDYLTSCNEVGASIEIARTTLGGYLHDLGKILYYQDDYVLCNLIVLKPNWITKAISLVLTDKETRNGKGILKHSNLPEIWKDYEPQLYPVFLRLMERFDLSYQIDSEIVGSPPIYSLVPQLLPYQSPTNLLSYPEKPVDGVSRVEMVYHFDFVPTGIMPWIIVRTHRYTTGQHWREGAILAYQSHFAKIELNPLIRQLRLVVWGVLPQNFFTVLKNTIDFILARFEGLRVNRTVPCICHWRQNNDSSCPRSYNYEDLVRRMEKNRLEIECEDSYELVSVATLLYGIHPSTDQQVATDLLRSQTKLLKKMEQMDKFDLVIQQIRQQSELIIRNFTRQWNLEMKKIEAECPSLFVCMPNSHSRFNPKAWIGQSLQLYLICQHPPGPHIVGTGYAIQKPQEWWVQLNPWLEYVVKFLKYGVPLGKVVGLDTLANLSGDIMNKIDEGVKILEQISTDLPKPNETNVFSPQAFIGREQEVVGPSLRVLHSFLKEADKERIWGGLHKVITPEGDILWLCKKHSHIYQSPPLEIASAK